MSVEEIVALSIVGSMVMLYIGFSLYCIIKERLYLKACKDYFEEKQKTLNTFLREELYPIANQQAEYKKQIDFILENLKYYPEEAKENTLEELEMYRCKYQKATKIVEEKRNIYHKREEEFYSKVPKKYVKFIKDGGII